MKHKRTGTFDELLKNRYGASAGCDRSTSTLEELVSGRYGGSVDLAAGGRRPLSPVLLSLSCDDGETLAQRMRDRIEVPSREDIQPAALQEYVIDQGTFSTPSSMGAADVFSTDDTRVQQEYQVDLVEPLREATDTGAAPVAEAPARPAASPTRPAPPAPAASQAQADDGFIDDMRAILSGQKVYSKAHGATVDSSVAEAARPAPPVPDSKNTHAIFDKIAQSMQYANAYDLGTIELNNRFADFDRMAELKEAAERQKKAGAAPAAPVDSATFLKDLEAIRQQGVPLPPQDAQPAESFSLTQSGEEYSRPLFDTGEHVLAADDLYPDRLRVGKNPGVAFSYGQIIAMGDLYESVEQMMKADLGELQRLKVLIERSTAFYKKNKADRSLDVSDDKWDEATHDRYLELAENNYEHFSPDLLLKNAQFPKTVGWHRTNKAEWERHHAWAIKEAQKLAVDPRYAKSSVFPEWPLIINAFGDHFLTDAFSSGHLINKDEMIGSFKWSFFNGASLKPEGEKFFERVAAAAFKGEVKKKFSIHETYDPVFLWWNPNIDTENAFRKLLVKAAAERPDQVANLAVKALHDRLNKDGIEVTNEAGAKPWTAKGDGYLMVAPDTYRIMRQAVQQSVANLSDPSILRSNLDLGPYFRKVWNHVPRLTEASKKKVIQLMQEYTNPGSAVLVAAAADIIHSKVDALIKKLVKEKKLKVA